MKGNIEVILVDIGNTHLKYAEVVDGMIGEIATCDNISDLLNRYPDHVRFIACSTRSEKVATDRVIELNHQTKLPIQLEYDTPHTLGMDRVAAAIGAYELFPAENSLIIDLGTCMTMDLLTKDGIFKGGIIAPGFRMRMKAMAKQTANLPNIAFEWDQISTKTLGKTTKECLLAGSYNGILNDIEGTIQRLSADFTSINVILTGGDAHHFESKVKAHIFAGSKIVLTGLYRIWKGL